MHHFRQSTPVAWLLLSMISLGCGGDRMATSPTPTDLAEFANPLAEDAPLFPEEFGDDPVMRQPQRP